MLETNTEPSRKFAEPAEPLAGIDGIADSVYPAVRGSEVGIAGQNGIIKKTGAPAGANVPVRDKRLHELPVDPASWVVHDLFEF